METKTATMTAGKKGPVLIQDNNFIEDMAHFNRERIPERVVHAKGAGAFGYFETTHDVTKYTRLSPFSKIGKQTSVLVRFSSVGNYIFHKINFQAILYRNSYRKSLLVNYPRKIFRKTSISYRLIRTRMFVCISRDKKCYLFRKFCIRTTK